MERLIAKYAAKLVAAGLAEPGAPLLAGLDDVLVFNRPDPLTGELAKVFDRLSITALLYLEPAEPYRSILAFLAATEAPAIKPRDCETRTFLHDLPVIPDASAQAAISALSRRKGAVTASGAILAHGSIGPEQAYVTASSICFSAFVKFIADYLAARRAGRPSPAMEAAMARARPRIPSLPAAFPPLVAGPFADRARALSAMIEAGGLTVSFGLVDSYFGNISCLVDDTLLISQTGSSLDELQSAIDPCPLDGSSCAGLTASSEFSAHKEIVLRAGATTILHGHPKFAVIRSMDCHQPDCPNRDACHVACTEQRFLGDLPIVPGEVGTGPRGLVNTLPPAVIGRRGAVVLGHGVFALGATDFNAPFATMLDIERQCQADCLREIDR